jgi:hypothetical protein
MSTSHPARALAGLIETLARRGDHRPDEWLRFLTMDVLAGFGERLETPWDERRHTALFELSGLYGRLVAENPWRDILGAVYMELSAHGQRKWMGQYFTPQSVADFMAEINTGDLDPAAHPKDRFITVLEPTSGAGILLLSVCNTIAIKHGSDALRRLSLTAIDLDPLCARMTACQLLANAAMHGPLGEILVYRGNSLGNPADLEVITHRLAAPPCIAGRPEPLPEVLPALAPQRLAAVTAAIESRQLSLFDDAGLPPLQRTA